MDEETLEEYCTREEARRLKSLLKRRHWNFLKLLDLANAVMQIEVKNPDGPKKNQKITYRGYGTHCGTQHRKKNFK